MSDEHPTIWKAEAHTLAKHLILKCYLDAWAAILANSRWHSAKEILFVDGFAGPGEYEDGEPGSPMVVLNAILDHDKAFGRPIRLIFIEERADRYENLCRRIEEARPRFQGNSRLFVDDPIHGDCNKEISKILGTRKPVGPALFFLDQFGYSQVPMSLVTQIMAHDACEVFSYLNCNRFNAYLEDPTKHAGISRAYGGDSWKPAIDMIGDGRQEFLIETYKNAISQHVATKYVWKFSMLKPRLKAAQER